MEHVESLLKTTLTEVERILSSRTVVGEPINVEGNTIIPLVSIGFGFGAGGGSGKDQKLSSVEGYGAGSGGGGGVKPVAVIIVSKDGVRVEPVRWGTAMAGKLGDIVGKILEKRREKKSLGRGALVLEVAVAIAALLAVIVALLAVPVVLTIDAERADDAGGEMASAVAVWARRHSVDARRATRSRDPDGRQPASAGAGCGWASPSCGHVVCFGGSPDWRGVCVDRSRFRNSTRTRRLVLMILQTRGSSMASFRRCSCWPGCGG